MMFERPLALAPEFSKRMLLREQALTKVFENKASLILDPEDHEIDGPGAQARKPYMMIDGIAVIGVSGVLVHSESWFSEYVGEMGYDRIGRAFSAAMRDPDAKGIALEVMSPGGDVDGCFELSDQVYEARGEKPICAICDPYAYSAAYALASACDMITCPTTGGVGSIGVIAIHMEMSEMLKNAGIGVSMMTFGERKADGQPFEPLSAEARSRIQADVDSLGEMFVERVARNRKLSKKAVRETQAATFMGAKAVEAGLADDLLSPQAAFAALVKLAGRKRK